ncbi:Rrf2 family transcriptional regulator [bacterium]|nr:Rrf2 family transcriptional regulator [bacterium]
MRITKWGEYGILCSLFLAAFQGRGTDAPESDAETTKTASANEIAESQQIPLQYTHQILQRLRKGDIITSLRGPRGGYLLSRPPHLITLKQILEASEGATFEIICDTNPPYGESCRSEEICGLSAVWRELKVAIDHVLEKKTLATLLESQGSPVAKDSSLVSIASLDDPKQKSTGDEGKASATQKSE